MRYVKKERRKKEKKYSCLSIYLSIYLYLHIYIYKYCVCCQGSTDALRGKVRQKFVIIKNF